MYEHIEKLIDEITHYLSVGGLFNPELMEHNKVRDLLISNRSTMRQMLEVVRAAKLIVDSTANYETFADPDFVYSAEKALAKLEKGDD